MCCPRAEAAFSCLVFIFWIPQSAADSGRHARYRARLRIARRPTPAAQHTILAIDGNGKRRRRLGRNGEGPGEFCGFNLRAAALGGDTVVGIDSNGLFNMFGTGARVLLSQQLFPNGVPPLSGFHGVFGGRLIMLERVRGNTLVYEDRAGTGTSSAPAAHQQRTSAPDRMSVSVRSR